MILSPSHLAARLAAARLPALQASLALLDSTYGRAKIEILDSGGAVLAGAWLQDAAGVIDTDTVQIVLTTPIEGAIGTAGTPSAARILAATGTLWAEGLTVSATGGGADIELESLVMQVGNFVRITSATIQG